MATTIELQINGRNLSIDADPESILLSILREDFDLTGTKYGCGEGQCGACTVTRQNCRCSRQMLVVY